MPKSIVVYLLAVYVFSMMSLVSGADYLGAMLPGGLPLGNALTALGSCAAAGAAVGLSARGTKLRVVSLAALAAAAAWLPVSALLAGNLELNFSGGRGTAWLALTLGVGIGVPCVLGWALAAAWLARRRASGAG